MHSERIFTSFSVIWTQFRVILFASPKLFGTKYLKYLGNTFSAFLQSPVNFLSHKYISNVLYVARMSHVTAKARWNAFRVITDTFITVKMYFIKSLVFKISYKMYIMLSERVILLCCTLKWVENVQRHSNHCKNTFHQDSSSHWCAECVFKCIICCLLVM